MKKIISLGAAAAVLSLTAVAASAAIAPVAGEAPVAGGEYVVEIVANDMTMSSTTFTVKASENLTLVDSVAMDGAFFNAESMKLAWAGVAPIPNGTTLLTLTFTVDAAADEEVSVSIVPDEGYEADIAQDTVGGVVVAGASGTASDLPTEPSTETTTDTSGTVSTNTEPTTVTTTEPNPAVTVETPTTSTAPTTTTENNVPTGIALAVVPVVLAAAGVVVAKKRK